ncbi:NosR regulatory protein [Rhodopirellula sallentina SM41]|uniref:NosR regulatory protein n=1 Tax=Rhodopirellula sallentina SM41 TaxID=1263870 RepID=M5UE56_9BACT|nr:NosR regulatory protein [Rhodopirellula sallentina SM41]
MVVLLCMLPSPHTTKSAGDLNDHGSSPPSIAKIQQILPGAETVSDEPSENGLWRTRGSQGTELDLVGRTMPHAAKALGYRGPTEAVFVMDDDGFIKDVGVLSSHDTDEHVAAVVADDAFLGQFNGVTWNGVDRNGETRNIDGVSGATLTSLAMAEGLLARLGAESTSLLFDRPIEDHEVARIPGAKKIQLNDPVAFARNDQDEAEWVVFRTGTFCDEVIGYQGPTELILSLDAEQTVTDLWIRQSLDNEPYVTYVREDEYFWNLIRGKTLSELADWNPIDEGVEGVSGATMTSLAIADSIALIASEIDSQGGIENWTRSPPSPWSWESLSQSLSQIRFTVRDAAVLGLLTLLGIASRRGWMRYRRFRLLWLTTTIVVIGFWTGNLISLSLLMGWAASGVSWMLALGLVALVAIALTSPPVVRGNPYCNHLCPHGAVQQLVRPSSKSSRHFSIPSRWARRFVYLGPVTFVTAYLLLLFRPATDVSGFEPFHAYLWPLAAVSSVVLCVGTLLVSLRVPMAYCRMGCPTGFLLDYLRRSSSSNQFTRYDAGLVVLLVVSAMKVWYT